MVNEKELRIGNAVLDDCGLPVKIDSIETAWNERNEVYYMFYDHRGSENLDISPIPLTEELLVKLGFGRYEFDHKENQYRLNDRLIVIRGDFFHDYGTSVKLEYVHQLQNLYFALTGKELEYVQ